MNGIYLVTDPNACIHHSLETVVAKAAEAGVSWVQLREKTADTRHFLDKALALKTLLQPFGIPLIINDRVDIALAARADGVHIGQRDLPYGLARKLLGPDALIGLSVETWQDVTAAQELDLDYIGVSPVFYTPTKTDTKGPWGLEGLARIKAYSRHPLVAIGGINAANTAQVTQAGADAVAVVSAICSSPNPFQATQDLCLLMKQAKARKETLS